VSQIERAFDASNVEFRIPAETIQLRDILFRMLVRIDQRRDDPGLFTKKL